MGGVSKGRGAVVESSLLFRPAGACLCLDFLCNKACAPAELVPFSLMSAMVFLFRPYWVFKCLEPFIRVFLAPAERYVCSYAQLNDWSSAVGATPHFTHPKIYGLSAIDDVIFYMFRPAGACLCSYFLFYKACTPTELVLFSLMSDIGFLFRPYWVFKYLDRFIRVFLAPAERYICSYAQLNEGSSAVGATPDNANQKSIDFHRYFARLRFDKFENNRRRLFFEIAILAQPKTGPNRHFSILESLNCNS